MHIPQGVPVLPCSSQASFGLVFPATESTGPSTSIGGASGGSGSAACGAADDLAPATCSDGTGTGGSAAATDDGACSARSSPGAGTARHEPTPPAVGHLRPRRSPPHRLMKYGLGLGTVRLLRDPAFPWLASRCNTWRGISAPAEPAVSCCARTLRRLAVRFRRWVGRSAELPLSGGPRRPAPRLLPPPRLARATAHSAATAPSGAPPRSRCPGVHEVPLHVCGGATAHLAPDKPRLAHAKATSYGLPAALVLGEVSLASSRPRSRVRPTT